MVSIDALENSVLFLKIGDTQIQRHFREHVRAL